MDRIWFGLQKSSNPSFAFEESIGPSCGPVLLPAAAVAGCCPARSTAFRLNRGAQGCASSGVFFPFAARTRFSVCRFPTLDRCQLLSAHLKKYAVQTLETMPPCTEGRCATDFMLKPFGTWVGTNAGECLTSSVPQASSACS